MDLNYWSDFWRFRELLLLLTWRDIVVRYKQTAIGIAWAVIRPLIMMLVFTVIFGRLAGLPSRDAPYSVLVFAAVLPWQFFSTAVTEVSNSLISNASIVSKVYFPRLIPPISAVLVALVDLAVSFVALIPLLAWFGIAPTWRLIALPLFLGFAICSVLGVGLWLAALNVRYRDVRYALPFFIQLGMFMSPVGFSSAIIPAPWRVLFFVNPMANVIDGFRWCLLGAAWSADSVGMACSILLTVTSLIGGIFYFRRVERDLADVV